jgi:DNA invertase Pin-like site-specific DNA recombinase
MSLNRGIRRPRGQHPSNLPSTYIHPIEAITPGMKVILVCRVSSGFQSSKGNNDDQEAVLRAALKARGATVEGVKRLVGRAWEVQAELYEAANEASQIDAVLLAESTNRLVRPPRYHPKDRPYLVAGANELCDLPWVCGDVKLVTLLPPDTHWKEERAFQIKRGQQQKDHRGGRPGPRRPGYKKQQRETMLSKVFWFSKVGFSVRRIANLLKQHPTQIQRWLDKLKGR